MISSEYPLLPLRAAELALLDGASRGVVWGFESMRAWPAGEGGEGIASTGDSGSPNDFVAIVAAPLTLPWTNAGGEAEKPEVGTSPVGD